MKWQLDSRAFNAIDIVRKVRTIKGVFFLSYEFTLHPAQSKSSGKNLGEKPEEAIRLTKNVKVNFLASVP